ncbi:unnamed protein product [Clavelina lepadiformis]|uniref:Uncharacterized protein n=1 Tax=Clavelina lepadiformis TaxID=159417 RepID=A0ABP0FLF1_CLALP
MIDSCTWNGCFTPIKSGIGKTAIFVLAALQQFKLLDGQIAVFVGGLLKLLNLKNSNYFILNECDKMLGQRDMR